MAVDTNKIIIPVKYSRFTKAQLASKANYLEQRIIGINKLVSAGKVKVAKAKITKMTTIKNTFFREIGLT